MAQLSNALRTGPDATEYAAVAYDPALDFSADFTIEAWIWPLAAGWRGIIGRQDRDGAETNKNYTLSIDPRRKIVFRVGTGSGYTEATSTGAVTLRTWTHVAATYDATTGDLQVWINGVADGDNTALVAASYNTEPLAIGKARHSVGETGAFHGNIAWVRFSDTVRYTAAFTPARTFDDDANTVALWPMLDGTGTTATDYGANELDLTLQGDTTWGHNYYGDTTKDALYFDGDDYVAVAHDASLSLTGTLTIEAWIVPDNWQASNHETFVAKGDHHSNNNYIFGKYTGGQLKFTYNTWRDVIDTSGWEPDDGMRHHVAVTVNEAADEVKFWVDGTLKSTVTNDFATYPLQVNANGLRIGTNGSGGEGFHGLIDEVRISDSLRYTAAFTPDDTFSADANTVALWHFDDAGGNTVVDETANSNDGTITGATWAVRFTTWESAPSTTYLTPDTGTVTDSLAIVYAANVALTGAGVGSEHATAQDESNPWPDSATWTTYEDWNAGTKSNVDVETTPGSVLLAEE